MYHPSLPQVSRPQTHAQGWHQFWAEDVQACFLFATKSLRGADFMPLTVEAA